MDISPAKASPGYVKVGNLFYGNQIVDVRPISGKYLDIQQSMVANFLFDVPERTAANTGRKLLGGFNPSAAFHPQSADRSFFSLNIGQSPKEIRSDSPPIPGQGERPILTAKARASGEIVKCIMGEGAHCLQIGRSAPGFKYNGDLSAQGDISITTWIYLYEGSPGGTIATLENSSAGSDDIKHTLTLSLASKSGTLKVLYKKWDPRGIANEEFELTVGGISKKKWSYVGFSYNFHDGMSLFANPSDIGNGKDTEPKNTTTFKISEFWPAKRLPHMPELTLFQVPHAEFDDVRLFTGRMSRGTIYDAYSCGHRVLCAHRAHATPRSRRVVCLSAVIDSAPASTHSEMLCTGAEYYSGAAIDVAASLDSAGVSFTFRDTSWRETAFEILRRPAGAKDATSTFESVVKIEGDLGGCASKFSSITYLDREAGAKPGLNWFYMVKTKTDDEHAAELMSTMHYFSSPWAGN